MASKDIEYRMKHAKTARGRRFLKSRAPQVFEGSKMSLFVRGGKCSQHVSDAMRELHMLRKPNSKLLSGKYDIRIFEDETQMQSLCERNDSPLFVIGTHSKHKPHRMIFGRMFNFQMLDMIEFAIENFKSMLSFSGESKPRVGSKPAIMFQGDLFDTNERLQQAKSLLLDHFRVTELKSLDLVGLDNVLVFTALSESTICLRQYKFTFKKSGTRVPRVELVEVGPSMDMTITRHRVADASLMKEALRVPKEAIVKKKKNREESLTASLGRVHMERQDLTTLTTRKVKGLKRKRDEFETGEGTEQPDGGSDDDGDEMHVDDDNESADTDGADDAYNIPSDDDDDGDDDGDDGDDASGDDDNSQ